MRVRVHPSRISGTIRSNASKSHAQRALALASMASGQSRLSNISWSDDVRAAADVCSRLCKSVRTEAAAVVVDGGLTLKQDTWHCGEAGFSLRMFTALAGLFEPTVTLTGEGSLLERPVEFMRGPIETLGAQFSSTEGRLPIAVTGRFRPGHLEVDGSLSSQFLSGLLMALPLLDGDSSLRVNALKSTPYIDLTIRTMDQFGVTVSHADYMDFVIRGQQRYQAGDVTIEGDWSGMAFLLVAGALAGEIHVEHLDPDSTQADKAVMEALQRCGAALTVAPSGISAIRSGLRSFVFDATHAPDLFPPLVSLAAFCDGVSQITGVHRLVHKESDRYSTLRSEFATLGIELWQEGDTMCVRGGQPDGGTVKAHGDHRIAMALATAALGAAGPVVIEGAECVAKSFPDFFTSLESVGVRIERLE